MTHKSALLAAVFTVLSTAVFGSEPTVRWNRPDDPRAEVEVVGLDPAAFAKIQNEPAKWLTVSTTGDGGNDRPPLLGTYRLDETTQSLRFRPRFPLEPGVSYRAVFRTPGSTDATVMVELRLPKRPAGPATVVRRVAPTGDVLPENLLRFYIEFSAPMSRGEVYDHISLLDGRGRKIDLPFLELGEELWDSRAMRFTLLFDPGRIKSGLRPRVELGPVLEAGKSYTLVIDRGWLDAAGNPLKAEFRKPFRVGPADLTSPDPKVWKLDRPVAGSRSALVARFPEPLDRAMLGRVLSVFDPKGKPLAGSVEVGADETSWSFIPEDAWSAGRYALVVDTMLEDRAGNSVGRPFEVDVFDKVEPTTTAATVSLPFEVSGRQ